MPETVLGVAAVARRFGVATGTLRTWDRRYGLGPSDHQPGHPRRYTARDLARLEVMRLHMLEGVTPAEAARAALVAEPDESTAAGVIAALRPLNRHDAGMSASAARDRPGGGRVVPLRDASPAARGLARAAMSLDSDACTARLLAALRRDGVVATWNELLLPVLTGVGDRWRATGKGVDVEHLLSESAEVALRAGTRAGRLPSGGRPVLLAAVEPEDHRLPLVALGAALDEREIPSRMLGVRLPVPALADAIRRTGPAAVFLWSQGAAGPGRVPDPGALGAARPRPVLVLGGPGYEAEHNRPGIGWVDTLEDAVQVLGERAVADGRRRVRR